MAVDKMFKKNRQGPLMSVGGGGSPLKRISMIRQRMKRKMLPVEREEHR